MNLDEFGTKDDRMSRIKKHGKTMKIWLTTVAGCFMSGCKNHRMGEPARLGNDSTQITATLEFIAATILICKHVRVCKHWFSTSFDYIILHLHTPKISKVSKLERTMRLNLSNGEVWMDWPLIVYTHDPEVLVAWSWCFLPDPLISSSYPESSSKWILRRFIAQGVILSASGMLGSGFMWR